MSPRSLYPRFGETVGKVSGVDWLFGLDEADPWVKTYVVIHHHYSFKCIYSLCLCSWRANSNVVRYQLRPVGKRGDRCGSDRSQVFHASYVLQVVSKRVNQTLVPTKNFVIGSAGLQARHLLPGDFSESGRDGFTIRSPLPAKVPGLPSPLDAEKYSCQVSPLRSPTRDSRIEKSPYMRGSSRTNASSSIRLADQSTLVDPLAPHDNLEQPEQDRTHAPLPQIPLVPTVAAAPPSQDCPRIDLVALVREKRKAKKLQQMKLPVSPSPKRPFRRVIPQDSSSKKTR